MRSKKEIMEELEMVKSDIVDLYSDIESFENTLRDFLTKYDTLKWVLGLDENGTNNKTVEKGTLEKGKQS